ncbi:Crp/Fnr family transcriptional regulator [Thalassospira marina]|uniref:Crp/Fnr family transcriptional regulator n=1 Tax=Thalassospira marina TaxID=2048283 RepID=A0A2N3KZV1_9PROT|nr:Crp/Fnr family transcriptional regulator [Thalassospira marina]AUG52074.1 Crp/Fnr family transcriptional regulator [Thalassospira marina]PKR56000.1 Crp/Fnr family transcriptional regulator [Thalassospira marina]
MNTDDALRQILPYADDKAQTLPASHILEPAQETLNHAYLLKDGLVLQGYYNRNGEREICRVYRPGDIIGLEALDAVSSPTSPPLISETLAESRLLRIPLFRLRQQQSISLQVARAISHLLGREVIASHYWKINIGTGTAIRRICRFLLWVAYRDHCIVPPRDKLGSIVSVTTETASRTIASLRRQGCLTPPENPHRIQMRINRQELLHHAGEFWDDRAA